MKKLDVDAGQDGAPLKLEDTMNVMQQVLKKQRVELSPEEEVAVRKAVAKALRAKQERLVNQRVERPFKLEEKRRVERISRYASRIAGLRRKRDKEADSSAGLVEEAVAA
jgi:hypothetical protein